MTHALLTALFLFAPSAPAARSDVRIYTCQVISFDLKEVKAHCDPAKPAEVMKIPREWLSAGDDKLKVNDLVHVPLNSEKYKKWTAMNMPARRKK
jgi:hypothetical protein